MARVRRLTDVAETTIGMHFMCPGCKRGHLVHVESPTVPVWGWNGSMDKPTFTPSLLVTWPGEERRCHSFITDGRIQFLGDCTHELVGQTVDLDEIKEDKDNGI